MEGEGIIKEPMDLLRLSLEDRVYVKLEQDRELRGTLHAYDLHLNMILSDVEEITTFKEIDEDTFEEVFRRARRNFPFLFVRGDNVILVSPLDLRREA